MSRRELAEAVNEHIRIATGRVGTLSREQVWRWERGLTLWPGKAYRDALRVVLDVESDADLGFVRTPRTRMAVLDRVSEPAETREPALGSARNMLGAGRELMVRALIRSQGFVLLVREAATGSLSLPGGRVGEGMSVQGSLQDHVTRQTGLQVTVTGFAGAVHHTAHPGPVGNVITLVFEAQGGDAGPTSTETFARAKIQHPQWLLLEDLADYDVQPGALRDALLERADGPFWRAWTR